MKSTITMDLHGVAELDAWLAELDQAVAKRIGRKAVREPAVTLRAVLALTAPYLPGFRLKHGKYHYGHLRDQMKVVSVRAKKPGLILYRVSTGDAFWGNFLELGTVKMVPHPWMRPQVDRMKGEIVSMQITILRDGIAAQARKRAKVLANGRNA